LAKTVLSALSLNWHVTFGGLLLCWYFVTVSPELKLIAVPSASIEANRMLAADLSI
jgi:hypothetical protein